MILASSSHKSLGEKVAFFAVSFVKTKVVKIHASRARESLHFPLSLSLSSFVISSPFPLVNIAIKVPAFYP